jgi:ubiquinone biosynthesis protein
MVEEAAFSIHNELDYRREGSNADRFRANFTGEQYLYIPKIYWEYTTGHVLVMEKIKGIKINDISALDAAGYNRKQVAMNAARIIVNEVLVDGFFHADPHPGNFVVMPGEVIGAMDFGLVGELSERDKMRLIHLYISGIGKDADSLVDELIQMSAASSGVDRYRLACDLERLLNKYAGQTLEDIRAQEIIDEFMSISSRYHLAIPANLWLLGKTLAMMEGVGLQLDPGFDIFSVSEPYVQQLKWQMLLPKGEWVQNLLHRGADWAEFVNMLPHTGRPLLEKAEKNELFEFGLKDTQRMLGRLNRLVNRLSLSVVIAGLVVSLAIMLSVTSSDSPLQILVVVGFIATVGLGIWLLISILRGTS